MGGDYAYCIALLVLKLWIEQVQLPGLNIVFGIGYGYLALRRNAEIVNILRLILLYKVSILQRIEGIAVVQKPCIAGIVVGKMRKFGFTTCVEQWAVLAGGKATDYAIIYECIKGVLMSYYLGCRAK